MRQHMSKGLAAIAAALLLAGCGKKDEGAPDSAMPPDAAAGSAATSAAPSAPGSWTPEALEDLLAPVALYPDVVLGHLLTASTNPQEVLDAGNWLIENQDMPGDQLDTEAGKLGLSPSVRALVQFPEVMDMMCMKMDWTTELGQAFTADQAAVLDAVQRLRMQAKDVGNLQNSPQLKVETESQDGKEIVTVEPPNPEVVYVPKYDPTAVYAPPPANIPPPTTVNVTGAPGTTTTVTSSGTTTTVASEATATEEKGHSTGTLVTTGLLAFGAGLLVSEVFDDDDDWDNYGPNYYHGGMYHGGQPYYRRPRTCTGRRTATATTRRTVTAVRPIISTVSTTTRSSSTMAATTTGTAMTKGGQRPHATRAEPDHRSESPAQGSRQPEPPGAGPQSQGLTACDARCLARPAGPGRLCRCAPGKPGGTRAHGGEVTAGGRRP